MAVVTTVATRATHVDLAGVSTPSPEPVAETQATYISPPLVLATTPSILVRHQAEALATAPPSVSEAPETPATTPEATPEAKPAFFTYTIQPGDSVSSIAAAFGIDPAYIMWNNPDVSEDPDFLLVGASILVPSVNGIVYTLTLGDTLSDVATYFQIDVASVTAFVPNGIGSPDNVTEGMVLLLPGAVPPPPPIPAAVTVVEGTSPDPPSNPDPVPGPPTSSGYAWPFFGAISQYFSGYHRGIDIDGFGAYGAPVSAAADGLVVLASYQEWGYGYHVIIEHGDGSRTLYAHLSEIWVSQGQYVGQGGAIGALGTTGYSTGPHLHFEIYIGGGPVNPLDYLY